MFQILHLKKKTKKTNKQKKLQLGKKEKLGLEVPSSKILFLARKFYDYFLHENWVFLHMHFQ